MWWRTYTCNLKHQNETEKPGDITRIKQKVLCIGKDNVGITLRVDSPGYYHLSYSITEGSNGEYDIMAAISKLEEL